MRRYLFALIFTSVFTMHSVVHSQLTNLLHFAGSVNGMEPLGSLISNGTFMYGMTYQGGTNNNGTLYKIKPDGTGYAKLLDFNGTINGSVPYGSLLFDGTFLYGMTGAGGTNNLGTIFKIVLDGTGYIKLMDFAGATNGSYPRGSLITDGTFLYGMTRYGGLNDSGTVFKIMPDGSGFVKLLDFANLATGNLPYGSLTFDGTFLYGMTNKGGTNNLGTVFRIMPDGSGFIKLLDFNGSINGSYPRGSLLLDGSFLYGMTSYGGINNLGTIFKIQPDGSGFVKLHDFSGLGEGKCPYGDLISNASTLYGLSVSGGSNNLGTIFKIESDGSGFLNILDFDSIDGTHPQSSLLSDGTFLYGVTSTGGLNEKGTIFRFDYSTLGINVYDNIYGLQVYPNPTMTAINITSKVELKNANLEVLNMTGQEIMVVKNVNIKDFEFYYLDLSNLDKGSYVIRLNNYSIVVVKE